jgi:hypothetical protein
MTVVVASGLGLQDDNDIRVTRKLLALAMKKEDMYFMNVLLFTAKGRAVSVNR